MVSVPTVTNHAPVTVALMANAIVAITLAILKDRYQIDFSGQEANLQVIATGLAYFVAPKPEAA